MEQQVTLSQAVHSSVITSDSALRKSSSLVRKFDSTTTVNSLKLTTLLELIEEAIELN